MQGYGNVGSWSVVFLKQLGIRIVAVSDSKGGILSNEGLDPERIQTHKTETGSVIGLKGTQEISNDELLGLDVDILIPAALENAITERNASSIKAKIV